MHLYWRHLIGQFKFLFGAIWAVVGTAFLVVAWATYGAPTLPRQRPRLERPAPIVERPPARGPNLLTIVFGGLGALFGGVGWLLVFAAAGIAGRDVELLRTGTLVHGKVKAVEEDLSVSINGRHPLRLVYSFRGLDGAEREGASLNLPRRLEGRWKAGDAVAVVCDPADPSRHAADIFGVREPLG